MSDLAHPKPVRSKRAPKPLKRGKRPRKQRKTSRGKMGRLADKLFSLIVRHVGQCANCHEGKALQCAHLISRSYRSVRWDERNAVALCASCHVYYTHRPLEWGEFILEFMGAADYEVLKRKALGKWDGDLENVLVRLAARAVALGIKP